MTAPPRKSAQAGGVLLALSIMGGTTIGILNRQASIGFLAGLGVGVLLLVLVWLLDRRRT